MTPKEQGTKANTNKWIYIELKSFRTSRKINIVERQSMEWEKIFANHITVKGFKYI